MDNSSNGTTFQASFDEIGTAIIVLSQMSFTCLGTLINNLLLVTLKDLPEMSASTYHVLLANLGLVNIFVCTILKPATGIYIGYAYAKVQKTVGLQFCQLYTYLTWTLLPILPWSLLALSWQVLLGGRRKETKRKTPLEKSEEETPVMSRIKQYHTASRGRNPSQRKLSQKGVDKFFQHRDKKREELETDVEKWLRNKAMTMEEGPRPGQIIVLLMIWTGTTILGLESLESLPERGTQVREVFMNLHANSSFHTRSVDSFII